MGKENNWINKVVETKSNSSIKAEQAPEASRVMVLDNEGFSPYREIWNFQNNIILRYKVFFHNFFI